MNQGFNRKAEWGFRFDVFTDNVLYRTVSLKISTQEEMMKKWKPAPRESVVAFEEATSGLPGTELHKMFGYSCVFAKGNMFAGLHEVGMVLRLPIEHRAEFLRLKGAKQFEPMPGRMMREYVVVPKMLLDAPVELRAWVEKSLDYVLSLPTKAKREKGGGRGSKSRKK